MLPELYSLCIDYTFLPTSFIVDWVNPHSELVMYTHNHIYQYQMQMTQSLNHLSS